MRTKAQALVLVVALLTAPAVLAQPRGSDPGNDANPILRFVKVVKQFVLRVLDQPMGPPPAPTPAP